MTEVKVYQKNHSRFYAEAYKEARDNGLKPSSARLFAVHEEPLRFQAYLDELERLVGLAEEEAAAIAKAKGI